MKKIMKMLLVCLALTGCGSDMGGFDFSRGFSFGWPTGPFLNLDSTGLVKGDISINGNTRFFQSTKGGFYNTTLSDGTRQIMVAGRDSNDVYISLQMKNINAEGTYSLGYSAGQVKRVYATFRKDGINYYSTSEMSGGYVTIDSLSTDHISGTFDITCLNGSQSVRVSNGFFECR